MDKEFKCCRVCYQEDQYGTFLSILDEGCQLRKIFIEKFGISYHHYMYNKRKALLCLACFEVLTEDPSEEILEIFRIQVQHFQRQKFSEAERKFFNWKFEPKNDFKPRSADYLTEQIDYVKQFMDKHHEQAKTIESQESTEEGRRLRSQGQDAKVGTRSEDDFETESNSSEASGIKNFKRKSDPGVRRQQKGKQTCPHCHQKFLKLFEHIETVHSGTFRFWCNLCGKGFLTQSGLQSHLQAHARGTSVSNRQRNKTCQICFKTLLRSNLPRHMRRVHDQNLRFWCDHCNKGFFDKHWLQEHVRVHGGSKMKTCPHCNKDFSKLRQHIETVHLKILKCWCDICGKGFYQKYRLQAHMRVHSLCGKGFFAKSGLQTHLQAHARGTSVSNRQQSKTCQICFKTISNPNFRRHMRMSHEKILRFYCDCCGKGFYQKYQLHEHMRVHNRNLLKPNAQRFKGRGSMKKTCPHCNKDFSKLREHIESVHERILRFWCTQCGKGFYHQSYLRKHVETHARGSLTVNNRRRKKTDKKTCPHCYKDFRDLRDHIEAVHNGVKRFWCDICGKGFYKKSRARKHVKIHSRIREVYQCTICKAKYLDIGSYNRHLKKKHNKRR